MTKKANTHAAKKDPAAKLTYAEAQHIAGCVEAAFEDRPGDLARLCLLLRWLAYRASKDDRESLYIQIEGMAMPFMRKTSEAVLEQMSAELDAFRKGGAR